MSVAPVEPLEKYIVRRSGLTHGSASSSTRCFECHQYHNWSQQRRIKAPYSIPQIRGAASLPAPVAGLH